VSCHCHLSHRLASRTVPKQGATYHNTWHILITSRNRDIGIVELSTCDGLNTICDDFSCLQREPHTFATPSSGQLCRMKTSNGTYIVIASETPIVPYCHPSMPCFSTACLTVLPRSCTGSMLVSELSSGIDVAYNDCLDLVSIQPTLCMFIDLLARISLPPDRSNAHLWSCLHHFFVWHACCIQHCLSSREVMASSQCGRVFV
jgi:hypothetical protein